MRFFLDIQRRPGDTTREWDLVQRFVHQFRTAQWPAGARMPEIYYYPASITLERRACAALHAKCIVIDCQTTFISSANFTEAAQLRNVEVGVAIGSIELAEQLVRFFELLVSAGQLIAATH